MRANPIHSTRGVDPWRPRAAPAAAEGEGPCSYLLLNDTTDAMSITQGVRI